MKLKLNSLAVDCIIGDMPEERVAPQTITVDVALTLSAAAAESDDLADTVDYASLADSIRRALAASECRMIERAARVALDECLKHKTVSAAEVTVTKRGAVAGLESASVVLESRR